MRIYENRVNGRIAYFEFSSLLTRYGAIRVVRTIPGVVILSVARRDDVFCIFTLGSRIFELWEPWGDNSRFHVGEKQALPSDELEQVRQTFASYWPWPLSLFITAFR